MNRSINRRVFLGQASAAGAGLAAARAGTAPAAPASPASKVVAAVVGVNGRGMDHIKGLLAQPNVAIAAVCDVDSRALARAVDAVTGQQGKAPRAETDVRRLLEDQAIDAVTIATPNHWHAPATILACAAGKHVYVEKPGSHNPFESEAIVAAAHRHRRVVQMGNQRRSAPAYIEAIAALRGGAIGRVMTARCYYTRLRPSIGRGKDVPPPAWLDYTLWQGPAPDRPYRDNLLHYNWHWFWHWGNGELGNNAVHALDVARWGLGVDRPRRVTWGGGRYLCQDDQETPDTGVATFDFGDRLITWEQSSSHARAADNLGFQVSFYGEGGTLVLTDSGRRILDAQGKEIAAPEGPAASDLGSGPGSAGAGHFADFVECIRSGGTPRAGIEDGQQSTMLCHYANLAVRTGHTIDVDPATGRIPADPAAMALWKRAYREGWEPAV